VICANCGTQNEPGTRFCDECGAALAAPCPNCGTSNRPTAKFCASCGAGLSGQAAAGTGSAPSIDAQSGAPHQAERRLVTVLFVDLVGFTPFAEERDAEQVRETLDRYFGIARLAIGRHGGTIEKFIGDAVMAVWGTPTAQEDDAERAVRAALELMDAVRTLGPGIEARAGILTGEAAVTIGAEGQGMVAGDLVNTASRLQSVAQAGTVLVGEATMRAAEAAVSFEPVGAQELKGRSAPVRAFRATRVVANRGGQSRSVALEAPFVGRDEELRQLKDLLHGSSRDPRVRLVSIVGPAGIGKSRLTWEFEKYVDGLVETIFWHRGRSPAYGEGVTFWALGEMVRRRAELSETDDEAMTRARIGETVAQFVDDAGERSWIEHALLTLLGVEPAPPGGRDGLFAAWRMFFERIAAQGTTALVFEDLQWADNGLLDFIEHVLEWSKNLPLLVITLSRPELYERRKGWGNARFVTVLTLEPLSDAHMRELLAGLAPGLPAPAVATILERADGIPLYAVETVRMLVADGKLELVDGAYRPTGELGELAVPETLRSLIASRLDALNPADRSLLQDASVLGQRFTLQALAAVSGSTNDVLEPRLRALARREFLDVEADPRSPDRGQYGFVQSLIREVAYSRLARRDRRARHLAAARYFEALGDDELAGVLATHYVAAYGASTEGPERDALGAQPRLALRAAAGRAATLGVHEQAVVFLRQALALTAVDAERAGLLTLSAESSVASGEVESATRFARDALAIYRSLGDDAAVLRTSALLGRILIDAGQLLDAVHELETAVDEHADHLDGDAGALLLATLARAYMRTVDDEKAIDSADRALRVAEKLNLDDVIAEALLNKASAMSTLGRRREARALHEMALSMAIDEGMTELELRARNNLAAAIHEDDPKRAIEVVMDSIGIARRMGQASIYQWQTGAAAMYMHVVGEDWDGALAMEDDTLAQAVAAGDRARSLATRALYRVSRGEDARAVLAEAQAAAQGIDEVQLNAALNWAEAIADYFDGDATGAQAAAKRAVDLWHDFWLGVLPIAARAAAGAGDRVGFEQIGREIEAEPRSGVWPSAMKAWVAGMRAALDGRGPEAAAHFVRIADELGAADFHFPEAEILLDAVTFVPSDPRAPAWAQRAREIFSRLKARPYLARLDDAEGLVGKRDRQSSVKAIVASEPAARLP